MKNWICLFLILGNGLSFSFELPIQAIADFYSSLEENRSEGEVQEIMCALTFREEENLVEKFLDMEEDFSRDLVLCTGLQDITEDSGFSFIEGNLYKREVYRNYEIPVMRGWGDTVDVEIEPQTEEAMPFFDLPLTNEDKKNIRKLIIAMADKNILQLLMEKKNMEKLGLKIRPVHPLKFAAFILKDPYLKKCLRTIEKDSLKWGPFVDGYEEKMKEESKAGRMLVYIPGFVEFLNCDAKQVQKLMQNKDYVGFLTDL